MFSVVLNSTLKEQSYWSKP